MPDVLVEDDDTAHVSYFPPNAWDRGASIFRSRFHGESYHVAHVAGAYISFVFNGSYVAYYSDLNANHGPFEVYLDGRLHGTGSSYADAWEGPSLLYSTNVEPGLHTLLISNPAEMDNGDIWLGVDYFIYRPLLDTPSTQIEKEGTPVSHSSNVPAIVASICGVLALVSLAILGIFLVRRRQRRRRDGLHPMTVPPPQNAPLPPEYAKFFDKSPVGVQRVG